MKHLLIGAAAMVALASPALAVTTGSIPVSVLINPSSAPPPPTASCNAQYPSVNFGALTASAFTAPDTQVGSLLLQCNGAESGVTVTLTDSLGTAPAYAMANGSNLIPFIVCDGGISSSPSVACS